MKTKEELIRDIDSDLWRSEDIADLLIRLDQAERIIRSIHLDFRKEAWEDADAYMKEYRLTDSGPL